MYDDIFSFMDNYYVENMTGKHTRKHGHVSHISYTLVFYWSRKADLQHQLLTDISNITDPIHGINFIQICVEASAYEKFIFCHVSHKFVTHVTGLFHDIFHYYCAIYYP